MCCHFLAIPLCEAKVDSLLILSRWLLIGLDHVANRLDDCLGVWAKALLGASRWRNTAVVTSELGWVLSGSARAVREMAMKRAKVRSLPDGDLYKTAFALADRRECG